MPGLERGDPVARHNRRIQAHRWPRRPLTAPAGPHGATRRFKEPECLRVLPSFVVPAGAHDELARAVRPVARRSRVGCGLTRADTGTCEHHSQGRPRTEHAQHSFRRPSDTSAVGSLFLGSAAVQLRAFQSAENDGTYVKLPEQDNTPSGPARPRSAAHACLSRLPGRYPCCIRPRLRHVVTLRWLLKSQVRAWMMCGNSVLQCCLLLARSAVLRLQNAAACTAALPAARAHCKMCGAAPPAPIGTKLGA